MTEQLKRLPQDVLDVLYELQDNGYQAYVVGGSLRDMLLDKTPKDWDIATDALPLVTKQIFGENNCVSIGEAYGTIRIKNKPIEITTFRVEGNYNDKRHPDTVKFVADPMFDSMRRDFTINSLYMDCDGKLIDYTKQGIEDIERRVIRCVGVPVERFQEDPLRMLRAVRFVSQLGFIMDEQTFLAILNNADLLFKVSIERVRDELYKLLMGDHVEAGLEMFYKTGLMHRCLLEVAKMKGVIQNERHHYDLFDHTIKTVKYTATTHPHIRLAALLHDVGKLKTRTGTNKHNYHFYNHEDVGAEMAVEILDRLKVTNTHKREIINIIKNHLLPFRIFDNDKSRMWDRKKVTTIIRKLVPDMEQQTALYTQQRVKNFMAVANGDLLAHHPDDSYLYKRMLSEDSRTSLFNCILCEITRVSRPPKPIVDGHVLLKIGVQPIQIGKIKEIVYWDYQIEKNMTNLEELKGIAQIVLKRLTDEQKPKII
jgi:putative nucleotidyltransferase with HDIG domain